MAHSYPLRQIQVRPRVRYRYAIYRNHKSVLLSSGPLNQAEVFNAKVKGALQGLLKALAHFPSDPITVCLDNITVIYNINSKIPNSSQRPFIRSKDLSTNHRPSVEVQ